MVRALRAFLDFCYLVRRPIITESDIDGIEDAIERFHRYREIFRTTRVRPDGFSLPRQHAVVHYPKHIRAFGAPNGLCTSITESKHIKAVKKPWRRSNKFKALVQMLLTNQRIDKLYAARVDFKERNMLLASCVEQAYEEFTRALGEGSTQSYNNCLTCFVFKLDEDDEDLVAGADQEPGNAERRMPRMARRTDKLNRPRALNPNEAEDREAAEGVIEGPQIFGEVTLANKPRKYFRR